MQDVIWKSFKLGDLFERSTKLAISTNQKDLSLSKEKFWGSIALISASRCGNGCVGYLDNKSIETEKVSINKITFDDQWGFTYFQDEPFVITGGHNAILEVRDSKLKTLLDMNLFCYAFFSKTINKITIKSEIFGYGYKINNKFDREIILLPCLEVSNGEENIWEENGKYYTLAVEYIKELMESAKALREQKTIKAYEAERARYEAERARYEAERARYEAEYKKEKERVVWKSFKLGELFTESMEHYLEKSKKNYNISQTKDDEYCVAVCAASKNNNGIVGYIQEVDDVSIKKRKGYLTKGGFGHVFYQDEWFIKPGGSWGMLNILKFKCDRIKRVFDDNKLLYLFVAKALTKLLVPITTWQYTPKFVREIILLPCLEVSNGEENIWEEKGKYYTLATNYISYIYLSGRINYNQKLVENYTYQY